LAFTQNLYTSIEELEKVFNASPKLDLRECAKDLRECLLLQLRRIQHSGPHTAVAIEMMEKIIPNLQKHFSKSRKTWYHRRRFERSNVSHYEVKSQAGAAGNFGSSQYLLPDFIVSAQNGNLKLY
jgi:RNA polymerase sigma-54 factor